MPEIPIPEAATTNSTAQGHRRTDRSLVVEASAGTGKTSTLLSRILHLVLEKGPIRVPAASLPNLRHHFYRKGRGRDEGAAQAAL